MSGIIKRLSMTGALRGGAVVREENGISHITLSVRGLRRGMSLYTAGSGGIVRTKVEGTELTVRQEGVCAAVLTENGRLRTGGFTGECAADRTRLLDEIRIRAATEDVLREEQGEKRRKNGEKGQKKADSAKKGYDSAPKAAVTGTILERAQRLFSVLNALNAEPAPIKEPPAEPAPEKRREPETFPVPNPFPRTFPGSVWIRREGDHRLFGEQRLPGITRRMIAVPVDSRAKGLRGARIVTARDGSRWMTEVE